MSLATKPKVFKTPVQTIGKDDHSRNGLQKSRQSMHGGKKFIIPGLPTKSIFTDPVEYVEAVHQKNDAVKRFEALKKRFAIYRDNKSYTKLVEFMLRDEMYESDSVRKERKSAESAILRHVFTDQEFLNYLGARVKIEHQRQMDADLEAEEKCRPGRWVVENVIPKGFFDNDFCA